jgi:hypothetical protein
MMAAVFMILATIYAVLAVSLAAVANWVGAGLVMFSACALALIAIVEVRRS